MGSIPVWADPSGPFTETVGPRKVRPESNAAHQYRIRGGVRSSAGDSGFALARAVQVQCSWRGGSVTGDSRPKKATRGHE